MEDPGPKPGSGSLRDATNRCPNALAADDMPLASEALTTRGPIKSYVRPTVTTYAWPASTLRTPQRWPAYSPLVDWPCLLYTSDAADDLLCVDLGGRRIIKK